jgi:hypothetical protein
VRGWQVLGVLVAVSLLQQADQWALPTLQASGLQVRADQRAQLGVAQSSHKKRLGVD